MNTEKLIRQLFVGKVAEIIGMEKTLELLKEATDAIEGAAKSKQADDNTQLPLDFISWYSGMEEAKILHAFERWKLETGASN